jgi:hypothetical protein
MGRWAKLVWWRAFDALLLLLLLLRLLLTAAI